MIDPRRHLRSLSTASVCAVLLGLACATSAHADGSAPFLYGNVGTGVAPNDTPLRELRVLGGIQFTPVVSLEVSSAKYFVPHTARQTSALPDSRSYCLNGRFLAPSYLGLTPFITAGVGLTRSSPQFGSPPIRTFGLAYGVGVQARIFTKLQVRLEWQDLNADAPSSVHPEMVTFSLGTRF